MRFEDLPCCFSIVSRAARTLYGAVRIAFDVDDVFSELVVVEAVFQLETTETDGVKGLLHVQACLGRDEKVLLRARVAARNGGALFRLVAEHNDDGRLATRQRRKAEKLVAPRVQMLEALGLLRVVH